jgi:chemotaxis protein MotB
MADAPGGREERRRLFAAQPPREQTAPAWVMTFGDMMSLLLAFFVLLLSFSDVDSLKFREARGSIRDALGVAAPHGPSGPPDGDVGEGLATRTLAQRLGRELVPRLEALGLGRVSVEVYESKRGVVVRFAADDLFVPGTDQLRPAAGSLVEYVAAEVAVAQASFEVAVEARTSADAPLAAQFPDVLALTTAQAIATTQALRAREGVRHDRIRPVGRGVALPSPRADGAPVGPSAPAVEVVFLAPAVPVR